MFQSTEQALAVAYWMFEHQPGPKSSTAMVIDGLRERFDRSFIEHLPSGLSPHEWQAQAVMTVRFAQRQLAARPPSSIREIERLSGLSKSTLHRWDKEWRERVVALLRQALQRLEEPMAEVGIVGER
ncbi:hypothetical protein [Pseudomonas aeruginosa]|uniref:hypothetical protein n=1 Tax=Pseudomonas aeruginosa TaxID=287 RepID=UPI000F51E0DC|nr:hypothetical protein [Pseudomonas aeruginosa]RPV65516.1 hypothetical protein IPC838_12695 [Pseudomonas aeruginosa]